MRATTRACMARRRLGAVQAQDVVKQRARGGLAAFGQPEPGQHGAAAGAPDAGDRSRVAATGHHAGRRAGDQREAARDLGRRRGGQDAERAGMGVDQAGGDAGSRGEPEVGAASGVERPRSAATGAAVAGWPARAGRSSRPWRRAVRPAEPGLVGQGGPLAGQGAARAGRVAGGAPGRGSRPGRRPGRRGPKRPGSRRFSHISFGSCISGDMAPPEQAMTRDGRWRCIASASAMARWSSQRTVSRRSSPLVETVTGRPAASRRTSEQVASKARPAISSGRAAASARAARRAAAAARQIGRWPARHRRRGAMVSMGLGAGEEAARRVEDAGAGAAGADVDGGDEGHSGAGGRRVPAASFVGSTSARHLPPWQSVSHRGRRELARSGGTPAVHRGRRAPGVGPRRSGPAARRTAAADSARAAPGSSAAAAAEVAAVSRSGGQAAHVGDDGVGASAATRARCSSLAAWLPPVKATTRMPAACAAATPAGLSSTTRQAAGA